MKLLRLWLAPVLLGVVSLSWAADLTQPEEAGKVSWLRDLDMALSNSAKTGKPVFALFQEIPGCAGCKQFGREVLSDPFVVAGIESEFTPLLIHNNKAGKDQQALQRFSEPAWNYQVVRFLDAEGTDIIPRKDRVWEAGPLLQRMTATLQRSGRYVPAWLQLVASEKSGALQCVAFAMSCFWTGEMQLGQIDGVITTEAGFIGAREVTLVNFDGSVVSLERLVAQASKVRCADTIYLPDNTTLGARESRLRVQLLANYRKAPESDQKRQLQGTLAARLEMSRGQSTKLNAWIGVDPIKAFQFLTPSQSAHLH